jgi:hypothetical protein
MASTPTFWEPFVLSSPGNCLTQVSAHIVTHLPEPFTPAGVAATLVQQALMLCDVESLGNELQHLKEEPGNKK